MKRILSVIALAALALSISSCHLFVLSETPPASVTNPAEIALYKKAVAGDPSALFNVGRLFDMGANGYPKSPARAHLCFRKASDAGYGPASFELCRDAFHRGDYHMAIHYGELAISQGNDSAGAKALVGFAYAMRRKQNGF